MMSVLFSDLIDRPWQMVVVDESHTIHTSIAGAESQQTHDAVSIQGTVSGKSVNIQ
jgi:hypothetical protein